MDSNDPYDLMYAYLIDAIYAIFCTIKIFVFKNKLNKFYGYNLLLNYI